MGHLYFASSHAAHPLFFSPSLSDVFYRLDPTNWAQFETTRTQRLGERDRKDQAMHSKKRLFSSRRVRLATCHSRIQWRYELICFNFFYFKVFLVICFLPVNFVFVLLNKQVI